MIKKMSLHHHEQSTARSGHTHYWLSIITYCRNQWYKIFLVLGVFFVCSQYAISVVVKSYTTNTIIPPYSENLDLVTSESKFDFHYQDLIFFRNETQFDNFEITESENFKDVKINEKMFDDIAASYKSSRTRTKLKQCPLVPPNLVGRLGILWDAPEFEILDKLYPNLELGGRFRPPNCVAKSKVAIIIPYRNREYHLRILLHNIHRILQKQQVDYGIYVIEEAGTEKFNRAMLMNIGFAEASKDYDYQCFVFHDVDLIPEDDRNLYTCPQQPRHMSVAIDKYHYRLPYDTIFGGVSAISKEHFEKINGYSNEFWGWGGEDDDMSNRLKYHGLPITRYPAHIATYTMLTHKEDDADPDRLEKLYNGQKRFTTDGLNSLVYERIDFVLKKTHTWILAQIKQPQEKKKTPRRLKK